MRTAAEAGHATRGFGVKRPLAYIFMQWPPPSRVSRKPARLASRRGDVGHAPPNGEGCVTGGRLRRPTANQPGCSTRGRGRSRGRAKAPAGSRVAGDLRRRRACPQIARAPSPEAGGGRGAVRTGNRRDAGDTSCQPSDGLPPRRAAWGGRAGTHPIRPRPGSARPPGDRAPSPGGIRVPEPCKDIMMITAGSCAAGAARSRRFGIAPDGRADNDRRPARAGCRRPAAALAAHATCQPPRAQCGTHATRPLVL